MQLVLIDSPAPNPQLAVAREAARIVRPWALLACGAVAYMAYTAYDSLPLLLRQQGRAVEVVTAAVIPRPARPAAPPKPLQMVTKCVDHGATSYSDGECAAGAHAERIVLAPDTAPVLRPANDLQQQVCAEVAEQARRIEVKNSLAPSDADHAWLEARRRETRTEQARLGC